MSMMIQAPVARAKKYSKRNQRGMNKCNKQDCTDCPYTCENKELKINGVKWKINKNIDCNYYKVVYRMTGKKISLEKLT